LLITMIRGDGDHGNRDTPAGSVVSPLTPSSRRDDDGERHRVGGERVHTSG
jgi:hypothetical protein